MHNKKKLYPISVLTLLVLMFLGVLPGSFGVVWGVPPELRELPGLREAPDIPVASIILRHAWPDHPGRRPPLGGGGCDKDVDLTSPDF